MLLDVHLGAEEGLALPQWIRQQPQLRHIPVIAVTAHAMADDQERILRDGCNGYVSRPVDFDLLREQLGRWLNPSRTAGSSK